MYKELDGIVRGFYYNKSVDRICFMDLSDRETKDANGNLRIEGVYGNALIYLCCQKTTDRIYLVSEESFKTIRNVVIQYCKEGKLTKAIEPEVVIGILRKYADKFIERGGESPIYLYLIKDNI